MEIKQIEERKDIQNFLSIIEANTAKMQRKLFDIKDYAQKTGIQICDNDSIGKLKSAGDETLVYLNVVSDRLNEMIDHGLGQARGSENIYLSSEEEFSQRTNHRYTDQVKKDCTKIYELVKKSTYKSLLSSIDETAFELSKMSIFNPEIKEVLKGQSDAFSKSAKDFELAVNDLQNLTSYVDFNNGLRQ